MQAATPDFFISYTAIDRPWAEWIAWTLEEAGYTVLIQAWDFQPGENFVRRMDEATRTSKRTIAILSREYFGSAFASAEWYAAFGRAARTGETVLIPVRVRECEVEGLLAQFVYVELVGVEEAAAKQRLLSAVLAKAQRPGKPVVKPSFPGAAVQKPDFPGRASPPESRGTLSTLPPRGMRKAISDDLRLDSDAAEAASNRLRQWVFVALFAISLIACLEFLAGLAWPFYLRAVAALLVGFGIAWMGTRSTAAAIVKLPALRRIVLGKDWIEGYWHIKTYALGSEEPEATGLVEMRFVGYPLSLHVRIFKLKAIDSPLPTTSISDRALLSSSLQYWNKWSYTINGETSNGYASGLFDKKVPAGPYSDNYQGILLFSDGTPHKIQRARKIAPSRIAEFQSTHGTHWRDVLLREMEAWGL